jgi:hypothetical protein
MNATTSTHTSLPFFGLFLELLAGAFAGFLIGFAYLVSVPPTQLRDERVAPKTVPAETTTEPAKPNPLEPYLQLTQEVTYFTAPDRLSRTGNLLRTLFESPSTSVNLTEGDLNGWASDRLGKKDSQDSSNSGQPASGSSVSLNPSPPQIFVRPMFLQIQVPVEMMVMERKMKLMFIAKGNFSSGKNGPIWTAESIHINSAPIPFLEKLQQYGSKYALGLLCKLEEIKQLNAAWAQIRFIELGEEKLSVTRQ